MTGVKVLTMYRLLFASILFFFFLSCSSEKSSEMGQKPSGYGSATLSENSGIHSPTSHDLYALEIVPLNASRNTTLQSIPRGINLSDAKIEWLVNGQAIINHSSCQFDAKETHKGDRVQAKAIIQGKELMSNIVEIKNAPPEITKVKILPEIFKPGDNLSVDVTGNDIDGDEVTMAYEWTKNGEPAGNGKWLEATLKRGDRITIKITPFDGEVYGQALILNREIKNMPPVIIEDNKSHFDGKIYRYQIKATDPDGDPLSYTLKQAPEGMVIDKTGLISWKVNEKDKDRYAVTVQVTDGQGGEALYSFNVTIGSPQHE